MQIRPAETPFRDGDEENAGFMRSKVIASAVELAIHERAPNLQLVSTHRIGRVLVETGRNMPLEALIDEEMCEVMNERTCVH